MTPETISGLINAGLGILAIILLFSFVVETLVEAIASPIFEKIPALAPYKSFLMYIAMVVGVLGAFVYQFDLFYILGQFIKIILKGSNPPEIPIHWLGITLTGLAIGKGSNYLHQLISKFFPAKQ